MTDDSDKPKKRQIPEKCLLCSKQATPVARTKSCWDEQRCHNRRSYARHRNKRNQGRSDRYRLKRSELVPPEITVPSEDLQQTYAVLHVYRRAIDKPVHAVGGEVRLGDTQLAVIQAVHCHGFTPRNLERYLERLTGVLKQNYGVRGFAVKEELHPSLCPLVDCPLKFQVQV